MFFYRFFFPHPFHLFNMKLFRVHLCFLSSFHFATHSFFFSQISANFSFSFTPFFFVRLLQHSRLISCNLIQYECIQHVTCSFIHLSLFLFFFVQDIKISENFIQFFAFLTLSSHPLMCVC